MLCDSCDNQHRDNYVSVLVQEKNALYNLHRRLLTIKNNRARFMETFDAAI